MRAALVIARKELRDGFRGRWILLFAVAFTVVAVIFGLVSARTTDVGSQGFNRSTAGLINLCLLLVPLLALLVGANSIAGERDRGTLASILAQPISRWQLLVGKYAGLSLALWTAISFGFGTVGFVNSLVNPVGDVWHYTLFALLAILLASSMLSVGMLISTLSQDKAQAFGAAALAWFVFVIVYDLAAIGLALAVAPSGQALLVTILLNPVEIMRTLAVMGLEPELEILGPLGAYLIDQLGVAGSSLLLVTALLVWVAAPLLAAAARFTSQDS